MKRPSRSKKRYKNDDVRPYFKRGEPVEVTRDFIENIGDPDFPRYGWIVKKSRPLMSDPGYEYLIVRDPEFAADDGYDETYWVNNDQIKGGDFRFNEGFFGDLGDALDDGIRGVKKFFHKAKFKKGDKIMVCMADFSPPGVQHGLKVIDTQYGGWSGGWEYRTGTDDWGNPEWWPELRVALDTDPDGGYEEYDPVKFPEFKKLEKYMRKKDSKKEPVNEGTGYTEENLIGRKITTSYGADRDPHNARPATIVDAHRRRVSTGMVFDLTVELDDTGETIEQTFNPMSVGDKYTWGPWFRDGEERQYNPYEREYSESKKLVKEGAGAAYTVTIKDAKLDNVKVKKIGDGDWEFEADIVKDNYMVEAADYYNLFCPMDSEFGGEEWVEVAGKVSGVCWWYDEDYEVEQEISGTKQDISFMYGHGWVHANLPEDGHIVSDHMESDGHDTWEIQSIELNAPQLAECVNYCHEHFLDEDEPEEDEEDGEQVNESSDEGWHEVTDAFEEFEQRLWSFTKQDMKGRRDAFSRCTNSMEKAMREYYNEVVYDGED